MPIYRPSELIRLLEQLGTFPKKQLSQNFLIDGNIVGKIVAAARLKKRQTVLEIGSGPGVLTERLLDEGHPVIALEKDAAFAAHLECLQEGKREAAIQVLSCDALKVDYASLLLPYSGLNKAVLIANVPYAITTQLLEKLLPLGAFLERLILLVQTEFADRLNVGQAIEKDQRAINVKVEYWAEQVCKEFPVSKRCFYPVPQVESALLRLELGPGRGINAQSFFSLVEAAFYHKRKMLKSSLKRYADVQVIQAALAACHLPDTTRPQEMSFKNWLDFWGQIDLFSDL